MEYFECALRWIFGAQLVFWGLNGFFQFLPVPPSDERLTDFVKACYATGFIMSLTKMVEVIAGILLLLHFAVPAALIIIAPVMIVVTGLHLKFNKHPCGVLLPFSLPYCVLVAWYIIQHCDVIMSLV